MCEMIRKELLGTIVKIMDDTGKKWTGKVVEIESPYDSDSGEIELGIDYAGGITMFKESEIKEIKTLDKGGRQFAI